MKKAIIFINGDLSNLKNAKQYIQKNDLVICADGAAERALSINIIPNIIIGDFDSLPKLTQNKLKKYPVKLIRFQREKDESDSELAIDYAVKNKCKEVLIFGLLGSRLDHVLTNIFSLGRLDKNGVKALIIEANQEMRIIHNNMKLIGKVGDLVSLIPINGDIKKITTTGLKYKLTHEELFFGYSRGISNVFTKKEAEISIKSGSLLIIHTKS